MTEQPAATSSPLRTWLTAFALGMALLTVERALLDTLLRPVGLAASADVFVEGLRFDAASVAYVLLPAWLVSVLLPHLRRAMITASFALLASLCLVELHFFAEFHRRLDFLLLEYLDDPGTAIGMAVAHVGGLRVALELLGTLTVVLAMRSALPRAPDDAAPSRGSWFAHAGVVVLLAIAARGGLGRPIRPQDVTSGPAQFHRQLALSGPFTLARHAYEAWRDGGGLPDYHVADDAATLARVRALFAAPGETFPDDTRPALRTMQTGPTPWRNVVLIVLESFAAPHVGALGAGDSWTPQLDRHAQRGVLFSRFLANGPSTNRGLPALLAGVPSLPKRTALTKSMEGEQPFLTLGRIVGDAGGSTAFLTAGDGSWENLGGWCAGQGFATVVDADGFADDAALSVWGVPDGLLLDRTLAECDRMAEDGAFCAVTLTSSNHPPFAVPDDFRPDVTDPRERAFRYADRAVGTFLDAARERPWANDTVFVLVGDHGLHDKARADIDPERYHVPLLLLDGAWPPRAPLQPSRHRELASQVDVLPTLLGLLGTSTASDDGLITHAAWGRDLLRADDASTDTASDDTRDRFAVLGPHGGAPFFAATDDAGRFVIIPLKSGDVRAYTWDPTIDALVPTETDAAARALATAANAYLATAHRAVLERRAGPADER